MTLTAIIPGSPRARISLLARAAIALVFVAIPACVFAQGAPPIVGSIEGEDFAVDSANGGTTQAIQAVNGQLASGARVTVKSGQARVIFNSGGAIAICGAARFQLLAAGGTLTVVLEYGEIDLHLDADSAVKIFTPLIVATPISIGGGARETIVGLARSGDMCLHTPHGAARVEQQLSGESLLVPQFGEVSLAGGQVMALKSPNGTCACQVDEARLIKPKAPAVQTAPTMVTKETIGALAIPETKRPAAPVIPKPAVAPAEQAPPQLATSAPSALPVATQEVPPAPEQPRPSGPPVQPPVAPAANTQAQQQLPETNGPIYKVLVPALTFDALSPAPPPGPNPETIILVRSVRVQQDTIYTDKVESKGGTKTAAAKRQSPDSGESKPPSHGFFASVGRFFRRIFS